MSPGEGHGLVERFRIGDRAGWVVRVVEPDRLGPARNLRGDRIEVRNVISVCREREPNDRRLRESGTGVVRPVSGIGQQYNVTRIEDRLLKMNDSFLRSEQAGHLGFGIE